jgi:hypothetical protein
VQKDIDGNNDEGKKYKPGQYFILRFDFSTTNANPDLAEANKALIRSLNSSFKNFYKTYTTYLGEDVTGPCGDIDNDEPSLSLESCALWVEDVLRRAKKDENEQLAAIQGIYLLVDEYDAFTNSYLEPPNTVELSKTWGDTAVGRTLKSFWSMVKSLAQNAKMERAFITGISPLSLSGYGSAFNVATNVSFHQNLAGLCGLTNSDLKDALERICKDSEIREHLQIMTKSFNGYHFCNYKTVETVYNTETCLAYLQSIVSGGKPEAKDPENSEVSREFLEKFTTSAPLITDFETALKRDENGDFVPFEYDELKLQFTLRDLVC